MQNVLNLRLPLEALYAMDGRRVFVFAYRSWARISIEGAYPLLVFDSGDCVSWEDWPDIQIGGLYRRRPALKLLLSKKRENTERRKT